MEVDEGCLRKEILEALMRQGFSVNPHLGPRNDEKDTIRRVHQEKKQEQLGFHKNFLKTNLRRVKKHSISGGELEPSKIDLDLIEVKPGSLEEKIFRWWNLVWWSIPYDKPIGRLMRFLLWDKYHDCPFGLFCLQSPPLRSSVRDKYLGLTKENIDYWINQSMYGQRIGALPPYNDLLGGKMVTLSLTANEVRKAYERKYEGRKTLLRGRILPSKLLFVTTTSAYGKSSVYERIKYRGDPVGEFIEYSSGAGTFHVPEIIYRKCLIYLKGRGVDTTRGYGSGPSRKMKLIAKAFGCLGIPKLVYHNVRRGYYVFSNVSNLRDVIRLGDEPSWYDRPFSDLAGFWLERWCMPRSNRIDRWREYNAEDFFRRVEETIASMGSVRIVAPRTAYLGDKITLSVKNTGNVDVVDWLMTRSSQKSGYWARLLELYLYFISSKESRSHDAWGAGIPVDGESFFSKTLTGAAPWRFEVIARTTAGSSCSHNSLIRLGSDRMLRRILRTILRRNGRRT